MVGHTTSTSWIWSDPCDVQLLSFLDRLQWGIVGGCKQNRLQISMGFFTKHESPIRVAPPPPPPRAATWHVIGGSWRLKLKTCTAMISIIQIDTRPLYVRWPLPNANWPLGGISAALVNAFNGSRYGLTIKRVLNQQELCLNSAIPPRILASRHPLRHQILFILPFYNINLFQLWTRKARAISQVKVVLWSAQSFKLRGYLSLFGILTTETNMELMKVMKN